ncbi:unnamed protein product [Echinostoma caproni]|uniref:Acylamino-acid-releasing enzyme n=1 Tax=Echinostoma caproni TaxID=27848 RepID=A0A183AKZ8_9TREM|nr:unnamed protein product [Echinostoma caproni]
MTSLGKGFPMVDQNGSRVIWTIEAREPGLRAICVEYAQAAALSTASRTVKSCAANVDGTDDDNSDYRIFRHEEDWGEGLDGVRQTVLCLLDVASGQVSRLIDEKKLPGLALCKPVWCPGQTGVVFLGSPLRAYCLGTKYCMQRPCQVYHFDIASGQLRTLSSPDKAARCPSFSPDGKCLVWLESRVGGPHQQCDTLQVLRWPAENGALPRTVVPIMDYPDAEYAFPGNELCLYGDLPERCWSSDSRYVVMSSIWGFQSVTLLIRVDPEAKESGTVSTTVTPLLPAEGALEITAPYSFNVWVIISSSGGPNKTSAQLRLSGVDQYPLGAVVHEHVSYQTASSMLICPRINSQSKELETVDRVQLAITTAAPFGRCRRGEGLSHLVGGWSTHYMAELLQVLNHELQALSLTEPLDRPERVRGLIVFPHGGPHGAFTACWSPLIAGFLASGFACLLINYRGSLGYGDQALRSILGHIGRNDVEDCVTATMTAMNKLRELLGTTVPAVLFGGSHGGFLVLHLAARYPSLYRVAVARNPVTHLVSLADTSDIPDWTFTEAGLLRGHEEWPLSHITDLDDFKQFSTMSPLNQLKSDWSAPLLLLLGAKDRRVPMSQGLTFYRKLKALCPHVPAEAIVLPNDAHPLESPVASAVCFTSSVTWFIQHLE